MRLFKVFLHLSILFFIALAGLAVFLHGEHFWVYMGFALFFIFRLYIVDKFT